MARTTPTGAQFARPPTDLYMENRRLELANDLLAEEARLAKDALKVVLDKLGFDWNPASRDYSIMRSILSVTPLPEVEKLLSRSEERRVESLHTIVQLRRTVEQVIHDRDEVLVALTHQVPKDSYRCTYLEQYAVVIETELGNACWFIEPEAFSQFHYLDERQPPEQVLSKCERTAALVLLAMSGADEGTG